MISQIVRLQWRPFVWTNNTGIWIVHSRCPPLKPRLYFGKTKNNAATSYLTLVCLSLLWCPEEAADSLRADDEDLQRVVADLLPRLESRFLTVPFLSGFPHSLLSSSGGKVPALTTCSGLKAWHRIKLLPQVVEQPPVRRNYLIHEWTCLFIRMSLWRRVFVAPKRSLYVNNPPLSSQYGMYRPLIFWWKRCNSGQWLCRTTTVSSCGYNWCIWDTFLSSWFKMLFKSHWTLFIQAWSCLKPLPCSVQRELAIHTQHWACCSIQGEIISLFLFWNPASSSTSEATDCVKED